MTLATSPVRADELSTCISCGLCLNDCPTFRVLGDEADSPRGRIALIRELVRTTGAPPPALVGHLEACLVCRACETACPSGVPFGRIMEGAREVLRERAPEGRLAPLIRRLGFALLADPRRLAVVTALLRLYQRSGLQRLARRFHLIPPPLRAQERLLPERIDASFALEDAPAIGVQRHQVALFAGCVMRTAFGDTDRATVRVLARNGCRVSVPRDQRCCGALHAHAGEGEGARALARANIAAFERSGAELVLVNAAGCGAHLKGYGHLLRDAGEGAAAGEARAWHGRATRFAARVRDVTEFLASELAAAPGALPGLRIAYQDACHLAHGQGVRAQPRALLRAIPGVTVVRLPDGERCCGSAGIYNLTHPEVAGELGRQKADAVRRAEPDVVVSANPGCIMQLESHLRASGSRIRVVHLMTLLDEAYAKIGL